MGSYNQVFGGNTINPAQLDYIAYTITTDLTLVWPLEAATDDTVSASKIDVVASVMNLSVLVPPADQTSVGQDILFRNTGVNTFTVKNAAGGVIGSVASGEAWYFYVIDNDTPAGTWVTVEFGVGVSAAVAAALAGAGLRANANTLDQNLVTTTLLANYAISSSDRATVLQSNGGALVWTFAAAATLTNGFFVYIINAGSGSLTLTAAGGDTIDGAATKVIAPTETLMVFSDGVNALHSLGYGRSLVNTVSGASINVAGSGTYTLVSAEVAAQVQDYTGLLTGNRIADYGSGVGYWFVRNNTSGAFSLTARAGGLDAGVAITQGNFTILRSNGTNMAIAFTDLGGTVTNIATQAGELTGGPITTTGTLGLANTAVVAGAYGSASETLTVTADAKGRMTALADIPILITASQISDFLAALEPVGTYKWTAGPTYGTGYLACNGSTSTIGNAASNGTARANADTAALYSLLWDNYSNTIIPIFTSGGVASTRGANAAADFAANKALALPDMRGRTMAHLDGVAGRLTATTMSPNGNTLGASGGAQTQIFAVSVSGATGGTNTSGALGVTVTGVTDGSMTAQNFAGGGDSGVNTTHQHAFIGTGATSGSLTVNAAAVSASGATDTRSVMDPTWIGNCFIKYA